MEAAAPEWKPRIEFAVDDAGAAAKLLRSRGVAATAAGLTASVADPDGTIIVFRAR